MTITAAQPVIITAEAEAALLEGILPITPEQIAILRKARSLKTRIDELESKLKVIRDEFREELDAVGAKGLLYKGKVVVRKTEVQTTRLDQKRLKDEFPEIANSLVIVTPSVRVTIL